MKNKKQESTILLFLLSVVLFALVVCGNLFFTKAERFNTAYSQAVLHAAKGQNEAAVELLEKAIAIDKNNVKAKGGLVYLEKYALDALDPDYDDICRYSCAFNGLTEFGAAFMTEENGIFSYFDSDNNLIIKVDYASKHLVKRNDFQYDAEKNVINTNGDIQNTFTFDSDGRLAEEILYNGNSYNIYAYCYDEHGQTESVSFSKCEFNPYYSRFVPHLYYIDYFENGRKVKTWHERDEHQLLQRTDYYNEAGQVIKSVNGENENGHYILYSYTDNGADFITEKQYYYSDGYCYRISAIVTEGEKETKERNQYFERDGSWLYTSIKEDGIYTTTRATDYITNSRPLTKEEIARVNTEGQALTYFMGSNFTGPSDCSISSLLYRLIDKDNVLGRTDLSEWQTLQKEGVSIDYVYMMVENDKSYRVPAQKVRDMAEKYLGIPLENVVKKADSQYSETYDCYYTSVTSLAEKTEFLAGIAGDNFVKLYTKDKTVALRKDGDRYYLHSVQDEKHYDLLTPRQQKELDEKYVSPYKDKIRKVKEIFIPYNSSKSAYYNKVMKAYNDYIDSVEPDGILENENFTHSYYLCDLTGDGIPELIEQFMLGGMEILFFKDGKLEYLEVPFGGGGDGGNEILSSGVAVGWLHKIDYTYYNLCSYNSDGSVNRAEWGAYYNYETESYDYKFNGETVDVETFVRMTEKYNKYFDSQNQRNKIQYVSTVDYIDPPK